MLPHFTLMSIWLCYTSAAGLEAEQHCPSDTVFVRFIQNGENNGTTALPWTGCINGAEVSVWRWLAVALLVSLLLFLPLFFFHMLGQSFKSKVFMPIPLQSVMILSFHVIGRTSAFVRAKTKSIRRCHCSTMKLSLQAPPLPFTNGLPQTFPFYVRHMLLLKLIANYHGLNELTPPPSLQMIHIISISISIIKLPPCKH